jgi:hypothetical protein
MKTIVLADRQNGREMTRLQLVRFAESEAAPAPQSADGPSIVSLSSKIARSSTADRLLTNEKTTWSLKR